MEQIFKIDILVQVNFSIVFFVFLFFLFCCLKFISYRLLAMHFIRYNLYYIFRERIMRQKWNWLIFRMHGSDKEIKIIIFFFNHPQRVSVIACDFLRSTRYVPSIHYTTLCVAYDRYTPAKQHIRVVLEMQLRCTRKFDVSLNVHHIRFSFD